MLAVRCNSHQLRLGIAPPTRLGGAMRLSHAIAKKHAFLYVFSRAAKNRNGTIFVNIEGLRPCLSKLSYRAPKWALMVRLMQQERRKSPQKSIFQKTGPFGDVTETAILAILASHFRDRMDVPQKSTTWNSAWINETKPKSRFLS